MKKTIVLGIAVVIATFSLAFFSVDGDTSKTGSTSYAQSNDAADAPNLESLMRRGELALEDGDWKRADEFYERVLDINPEHAPAYLGKLLAELKIKSEADLTNHGTPLDNMPNYQKALRFADARYRTKVTGYNQSILARHAEAISKIKIGSVIQFGGMDWRVLDIQGKRALIITENIIEQRPYNVEYKDITWETCTLRKYLNGEFYAKFTKEDQGRIVETKITNPDNLWYGTKGGNDTTDKIFLLSLEEADKYFGNSGDYHNKKRSKYEGQYPNGKWVLNNDGLAFSNANDSGRIAKYNDKALFWWLRSPARYGNGAAIVHGGGGVYVNGDFVNGDFVFGGVRPALFLNL